MTPAPTLEQLIHEVERDAPDPEPLTRLRTAATMLEVVTSTTDAVLGYYVDQARRAGHSWAEIGASLGVTKQAAQQRQISRTATLGIGSATFDRFTIKARNVVTATKSVADDLGHNFIGTEHLLLALYREPDAIAAQVLDEIGLSQDAAREAVLRLIPRGTDGIDFAPFTPRAMSMFKTALGVALELGHNYIGTEHLLLALARSDGVAARVLTDAGASYNSLVPVVREKLARYAAKQQPAEKTTGRKPSAKKVPTTRRKKN